MKGRVCFASRDESNLSGVLIAKETTNAKVVRFHETGGPEVLKFEDVPLQQPGPGEVRLKVQAI